MPKIHNTGKIQLYSCQHVITQLRLRNSMVSCLRTTFILSPLSILFSGNGSTCLSTHMTIFLLKVKMSIFNVECPMLT